LLTWENLFVLTIHLFELTRRITMKVNGSASPSSKAVLAPANAAKKPQASATDSAVKAFAPIAASALAASTGVAQASAIAKAVSSVGNEIKDVANDTMALATSGVNELKSAYNSVSNGVSTVTSGVGTAASAIGSYTAAGISAGVQAITALV
jgi:hypothetical protein